MTARRRGSATARSRAVNCVCSGPWRSPLRAAPSVPRNVAQLLERQRPSSAMSRSPSLTASASGRSRRPLHAEHVRVTRKRPSSSSPIAPSSSSGSSASSRRGARAVLVVEPRLEPRHDADVLLLLPLARAARAGRSSPGLGLAPGARLAAVAEQDRLLRVVGELRPRHVGIDAERLDGATQLRGERDRAAPAPREDDALAERALRIADDALGIDDACARRGRRTRGTRRAVR